MPTRWTRDNTLLVPDSAFFGEWRRQPFCFVPIDEIYQMFHRFVRLPMRKKEYKRRWLEKMIEELRSRPEKPLRQIRMMKRQLDRPMDAVADPRGVDRWFKTFFRQ